MTRILTILVSVLLVTLVAKPQLASADGSWLDGPPTDWNTAGMAIPQAPPRPAGTDPRCFDALVVPDTAGKQAVLAAGWFLLTSPQSTTTSGNAEIVFGQSSADGMCRPAGYQAFVFVDGVFAGTLSPSLMISRDDGALTQASVVSGDQIRAEYVRYTRQDPLCCPSAKSTAAFEIVRTGGAPVVHFVGASTLPAGSPPTVAPVPSPSPSPVRPPVQAPVQLPRNG